MLKKVLCALLCVTYSTHCYAKSVRQIEADDKQVVLIKTALGYSTVIEFTSKPISAVVGDQDAFKLEFVKNSITVKPLIPHAASNLFVFTEYDRFNCTLKTVSSSEVDYLVRISSHSKPYRPEPIPVAQPIAAPPKERTKDKISFVHKRVAWQGYSLALVSFTQVSGGPTSRGATVYEIELDSKKEAYRFSAASLGVKQNEHFIPIESIYLDRMSLNPGYPPIRGKIALLNSDFNMRAPITIVFAVPGHRLFVTLPGAAHSPIKKGK